MKTKTKLFIFLSTIILLFATPLAIAKENGSDDDSDHGDKSKVEVRIENRGNQDNDEDENEVRIRVRANENSFKFEENENEFEISGEISSLGTNTFVVLGQTITIDPSKVGKFEQKGILENGKKVKVEGVVIDGTKFAKEIKVIGTGQGRFKFEIKGINITPTLSVTPTITPSVSPTITPDPTVTITPTSTPSSNLENVDVNIKAKGPIDEVAKFFEQILSFLKSLV